MSKIAEIRERAEDAKKNHDYLAGLCPQTIINLCVALEEAKIIIDELCVVNLNLAAKSQARIDQILGTDAS